MTPGPSPESPTPTNRLVAEKSPYLLQHAHNPVDWHPWGEEAFALAADGDRPIFLSIGYATCHWCHVMERESFEDASVAALLNAGFVPIKVDREERPDIDAVYMSVCQMMTGHGGWPLTIVMTPDKRPFFAGTYFPRETAHGRIGMLDLLPRLRGLWLDRRDDLEQAGSAALEAVRELDAQTTREGAPPLDERTLERGFDELRVRYDPHQGGFGRAPKFPTPHQLLFLLGWHARTGRAEPLDMVTRTLTRMRLGGIFDHVGFGFHRYSTDARWLVPHFEKMLYDQALMAMAATDTWWITGDNAYRRLAEEVLTYVLRDLRDPDGAFYSAEDADSEGREGAFYLWTREELDRVLGAELDADAAELARRVFRVETRGNFADEASGERTGENILHLDMPLQEVAEAQGREPEALSEELERIRRVLFDARSRRPRPLLDDKILTDWNGLMIAALARAGRAFGEAAYVEAAAAAARFISARLRDDEHRLLHRYRDGDAAILGGALDHAALAWGLLELYAATFDPRWLADAAALASELAGRFWDEERAGVFSAAPEATDVPVRQRETYDGAIPSANALAWLVFLRLAHLTGELRWSERAGRMAASFAAAVSQAPSAHTMWLVALDLSLGPTDEVVVAGTPGQPDTDALLDALRVDYRPRTAVLLQPGGDDGERLASLAPFTRGHTPVDGKAAAYVCREFACQRPTTDASEMVGLLERV